MLRGPPTTPNSISEWENLGFVDTEFAQLDVAWVKEFPNFAKHEDVLEVVECLCSKALVVTQWSQVFEMFAAKVIILGVLSGTGAADPAWANSR